MHSTTFVCSRKIGAWTWDSGANTEGRSPVLFNSAAELTLCPADEAVWLCFLSVFSPSAYWALTEVMQFGENYLYWFAFSAGFVCLADLTLSSVGYVAK